MRLNTVQASFIPENLSSRDHTAEPLCTLVEDTLAQGHYSFVRAAMTWVEVKWVINTEHLVLMKHELEYKGESSRRAFREKALGPGQDVKISRKGHLVAPHFAVILPIGEVGCRDWGVGRAGIEGAVRQK